MEGVENRLLPQPYSSSNHSSEHVVYSKTSALILAKIVAMVTLGVASFVLGMVPVKIASWLRFKDSSKVIISGSNISGESSHYNHHGDKHDRPQPALISLLLCYGGGVLLYTTFMHLQPEVREAVDELTREKMIPEWFADTGLSLSDLLFCCGFFFVYLVEESVHWLLDRNTREEEEEEDEEAALHRTMSLRHCKKTHYRDVYAHSSPNSNGNPANIIPRASLSVNGHRVAKTESNDEIAAAVGSGSVSASTQGLLPRDQISVIDIKSADRSPLDPQIRMFGGPLSGEEPLKGFKGGVDDEFSKDSRVVAKSFRGLLTVLALSFHAVFEGLAVGLEVSVRNVWYMFAAIATHKLVIAFCVGIELVSSRTRLFLMVVYIATFASVTPLGIAFGIALRDHEDAAELSLVPIILQGMAAGTLLYVIFFEVLQRERNSSNQSGALQLVAIFVGFSTMLLLQLARK